MVLNSDLSFASLNLLNALERRETWEKMGFSDSCKSRNGFGAKLVTLDIDITVLHSPWPQEKNPVLSELSKSGQRADMTASWML